MTTPPTPLTRWYQEPWAWLVFGLPLATVVACMVTIAIAVTTSDGLVVDDYYKQGLEINRVLDREAHASELGLGVAITALDAEHFALTLSNSRSEEFPATLHVLFAHATRDEHDQKVTAEHLGSGHYRGLHQPLAEGPWYVEVSGNDWRLMQRIVVGADSRPKSALNQ